MFLHPVSDFINSNFPIINLPPSYYYEGRCPQSGELLRLPRTHAVEAIAHSLMQHLPKNVSEGKMYGVLLVELPTGEQRVLKAFSGLLNGCSVVDGWVPPIPGRNQVALAEARTLAQLEALKQEMITLKQLPERQQYETMQHEFELVWQKTRDRHQNCKYQRDEQRQTFCQTLTGIALAIALEQLDEESRQQGIERRQLKLQHNAALQPLKQLIEAADTKIRGLKQQRKALSCQLQAQMHAVYSLTNFSGQSLSLQQLMPEGMPTGTGDCCAPKLLHYAAIHGLKPVAMAEFWWGASSATQDKVQGEFYGACAERCQPLMGFLLSGGGRGGENKSQVGKSGGGASPAPRKSQVKGGGLRRRSAERGEGRISLFSADLPIIYEDSWLIAVDKPAGLLSVPGRYRDRQDSVLSRLYHLLPDGIAIAAVHRLDRDTSGIILFARDRQTHRQLSWQFQQRQVHKIYEAVLSSLVTAEHGVIELPLWADLQNRPAQTVDWQHGKPSSTSFRVIAREGDCTRLEFVPLTGRTHQLRVHAADAQGLGIPILGDRLYGCLAVTSRLHLHARELSFQHPQSGKTIHLQASTEF